MLGTLPVALTAARCSREVRLVSAVLFWMMRGPPIASSMGRLSLVSLGFWLICIAARRRRQWQASQKVCCGIFAGTMGVSAGDMTL